MPMTVGYPAVYNGKTQSWEDVYIRTRASEVFFDDGQTLDYKVKSGQFDSQTTTVIAENNNDINAVSSVISAGIAALKEVPIGINLNNGGTYINKYTEEGTQFIHFEFVAEDMIRYDCYGYWIKKGKHGTGIFMSWQPSYGVWQVFTANDGISLVTSRVYPIEIQWCDIGFVNSANGGKIFDNKTVEGFNYVNATINGIKSTGYWLKKINSDISNNYGTGILIGEDNRVRCLKKDGYRINYTTLKSYDEERNPTGVQPLATWFDIGTISETRKISLIINSKVQDQGLYLIKFNYNDHDFYGLWLQWHNSGAGFVFDSKEYSNGYYPCYVIDSNGRFVEFPQRNKEPEEETTVTAIGTQSVITGILKKNIPVGTGSPVQISYHNVIIKGRFFRHDKIYGTGIGYDSRGIAYHIYMYDQFLFVSVA